MFSRHLRDDGAFAYRLAILTYFQFTPHASDYRGVSASPGCGRDYSRLYVKRLKPRRPRRPLI